jgi:hypothetical protein
MKISRPIRKLKKWVIGNDFYPSVYREFKLSNTISYYLNVNTLKFWTLIARHHEKFSVLYDKNVLSPSLYSSSFPLSSLMCDSLDSLTEKALVYGTSFFPNFLPSGDYSRVCSEFEGLANSEIEPITFGDSVKCLNSIASSDVTSIFKDSIRVLTHRMLGKSVDVSSIGMQYLYLDKNFEDRGDPNTLPHIDRYIPCLKVFYFPYYVTRDSSPFGYIPVSHRVTDSYLESVQNTFVYRSNDSSSKPPFQISNPSKFTEILLEVPNNTLVIAFTNGIHRRVPFSLIGNDTKRTRSSLRFNFYNKFTSYDLMFSALRGRLEDGIIRKNARTV